MLPLARRRAREALELLAQMEHPGREECMIRRELKELIK